MPTSPHPTLFDRETQSRLIRENYQPQVEMLADLANYGSKLIVRAFESSSAKNSDVVICFVLLKQIVAMVDSVQVLMSQGCIGPAFLSARTAFEASLYVELMLDGQSERKAGLFLVSNYRNQREFLSSLIKGASEKNVFKSVLDEIGFDVHRVMPESIDSAKERLRYIDDFLKREGYRKYQDEFEQYRLQHPRKKYDPYWYEILGYSNISKIAKKYRRSGEYGVYYSGSSRVTHTSSYYDHFHCIERKFYPLPIRHLAEVCKVFGFTVRSALHAYYLILKNYRPLEIEQFRKKYLNDWQNAFRGCKEPQLNFE